MHRSKNYAPTEHLDCNCEEFLTLIEHNYRDLLFFYSDVSAVALPNATRHREMSALEFCHTLICKSFLEAQTCSYSESGATVGLNKFI